MIKVKFVIYSTQNIASITEEELSNLFKAVNMKTFYMQAVPRKDEVIYLSSFMETEEDQEAVDGFMADVFEVSHGMHSVTLHLKITL